MEKRRTFLPLVLALVLCLSLAACGDDGGGSDDDVTEAPEAFEGLVKDTAQLTANYAMYRGVWLGDGGTLVVEESADGDEMRFVLYDAGEDIAAQRLYPARAGVQCGLFLQRARRLGAPQLAGRERHAAD